MYANIINYKHNKSIMEGVIESPILKYVNFYDADDLGSIDKKLPTMYVGWDYVQDKISSEIDILESKINDKEFWTFAPEESMVHFLDRSRKFLKIVPESLVNHIEYVSLDPFFYEGDLNGKVREVLGKAEVVYLHNNAYFAYSGGTVYGVNGGFMEVFGEEVPEFDARLLDDKDNKIHDFFVTVFGYDSYTVQRYIPYLVTLKKEAAKVKRV
jgi:hypothetical protein